MQDSQHVSEKNQDHMEKIHGEYFDSEKMHQEMLKVSEEFYQSLNIPYRVVLVASGELNQATSKKYDLEGWFPGFQEFRELVSCSNCKDFPSRKLEIRFGESKTSREKEYVHMLNSTLVAAQRCLCCVLENYSNNDGIVVPDVLRPFMGGIDFIPFVAKPPSKGKGGKKKK
ncbi:serine--tRNA ligase cytoplasmic-related [Anaeramoeba ignava]|uniref:Serine--tRNA ligase cytoplasmic-related n=1 Tax=Anaeramoeba ignava TaxID=1746090 RepID=A0A9Q0L625_ANAIG|nr:serine--tRNA ligase cytoplasmic-related [Anaeramoeba ignava]